ncbi:type II toxin-antitoxin system ParD family antitoxin [Nitrospirillum amazonense]|uniref:type II toxin-antitoxin system ParD family antitoxin n=1 Tax=Nitrospirillum amazonense TaxID=28077 RepID=UPI002DD425F9|nr:type II toxin-antitoxin system ParD family antitoxin [Nitrospirillum amazonense]MEC4594445.1 type II toxin-antitoxin system ParD family antitoxin [Nitrospirillum amazonense]
MGKNTSVSLGEHFTQFVETQVAQGRYGSASDVMRAGLRLLEEREAKLAALRAALDEGEASGISSQTVLDIWAEVKAEADETGNG